MIDTVGCTTATVLHATGAIASLFGRNVGGDACRDRVISCLCAPCVALVDIGIRRVRNVGDDLYHRIDGGRADGAPRDSAVFSGGTAKGLSGVCGKCRLCLSNAGDAGLGGFAGYDGRLVLLTADAGGEVEAIGQVVDFLGCMGGRDVSLFSRHSSTT